MPKNTQKSLFIVRTKILFKPKSSLQTLVKSSQISAKIRQINTQIHLLHLINAKNFKTKVANFVRTKIKNDPKSPFIVRTKILNLNYVRTKIPLKTSKTELCTYKNKPDLVLKTNYCTYKNRKNFTSVHDLYDNIPLSHV